MKHLLTVDCIRKVEKEFDLVLIGTTPFFPTFHTRVSCETKVDSKQPKLEPKLVSILSETRRLFRLFRFNIETGSFGLSIEPKHAENNLNKPKKVLKLL
jgi:hypothetical protein